MTKISEATDIVTPQSTDVIPIERPSNLTKYKTTPEEIVNSQVGGDASSNTFSNNGVAVGLSNQATFSGVAMGSGNIANGGAYSAGSVALGADNSCPQSGIAFGNSNVASGLRSIAIGYGNLSTGTSSIAIGTFCEAIGPFSVAIGDEARSRFWGHTAFGGAPIAIKDNQSSIYQFIGATSDATPTELTINGSNRLTIPTDNVFVFQIQLAGITQDAAVGASWIFQGAIKNAGGNTSLIGAVSEVLHVNDGGAAAWNAAATADDTNDALVLTVTGDAGTTIRWRAMVLVSELLFT